MDRKLVNVAIASAFFEEKKNLMDTYYPFVLKTFENRKICTLENISNQIKSLFDIELPINSIKNILTKSPNTFQINKTTKAVWEIALSVEGQKELNQLILSEETSERKLGLFYQSIKDYASKYFDVSYNLNDITTNVNAFVTKNIYSLTLNLNKNGQGCEDSNFEKVFVNYLSEMNIQNPELLRIFDEVWKGSVIMNELKKESFEDQDNKLKKNLTIYVDSNFILSLLELHNPIINQAAKELFTLIKGIENITLAVLDITLKEIYDLIDVYDIIKNNFTDIEIDSVFYYLKQRGYTNIKLEQLKDSIEDKLHIFGIIKEETLRLDENDQKRYAVIYDHIFQNTQYWNEKKPERSRKQDSAIEKSVHHDASAIVHVLRYTDRYARNFEESKVIFLTSSYNLYKNYSGIYKKLESFPCVILDSILTNILYLKNPQKGSNVSLSQIIKAHCNYLIVDHNIWNNYLSIIKELKKEEKITMDDYTRLITKNQITKDFLLNTDSNIDEVKVKEVLSKIKEKERLKDKQLDDKSKEVNDLIKEKEKQQKEIEDKYQQKEELLYKTFELEKEQMRTQLNKLEFEMKKEKYTDTNVEEQMSSLFKSLIWCIGLVLLLFILNYQTVLLKADLDIFNFTIAGDIIKAGISVIITISVIGLGKLYRSDFFRFIFARKRLKQDLKIKYEKEYQEKHPLSN